MVVEPGIRTGGAHALALAEIWRAGFLHGAMLGAMARDLDPKGDMDELLRDPMVYRTAVVAGTEALLKARPVTWEGQPTPEQIAEFNKMLDILSRAAARGTW